MFKIPLRIKILIILFIIITFTGVFMLFKQIYYNKGYADANIQNEIQQSILMAETQKNAIIERQKSRSKIFSIPIDGFNEWLCEEQKEYCRSSR